MNVASSAWSEPTCLSPPSTVVWEDSAVHLRNVGRVIHNLQQQYLKIDINMTCIRDPSRMGDLRWGVGVVQGGGGPNSLPGSSTGMGVCCGRSFKQDFACATFFDVDIRGVFGVGSPPSAAAFVCSVFLWRFEPPFASAGGICVQGTISASSATCAARPWSNRGESIYVTEGSH